MTNTFIFTDEKENRKRGIFLAVGLEFLAIGLEQRKNYPLPVLQDKNRKKQGIKKL